MRPLIRTGIAVMLAATAMGAAQRIVAAPPPAAAPAGKPRAEAGMPPAPKPMPISAPNDSLRAQIRDLGNQLVALRKEFHAQLDPLEAQVKSLRQKYDPQIQSLEEQRKALVEQGKPVGIQELDRQEEAELAALAQREKDEIDRVKQRYAGERTAIHKRFDELRGEIRSAAK